MGRRFIEHMTPIVEKTDWIAELRGQGLMQAIEFVHPGDDLAPDPDRATEVLDGCRQRGLPIGKGGLYGNVVRIAPMLNFDVSET